MKLAVLSRDVITGVLDMGVVLDAVARVYRDKAAGRTAVWPSLEYRFEADRGVMDIRSGYLAGDAAHGAKLLNNFPGNARLGLPSFSGLLMIFDSETGLPQAVADASFITSMRTGAAAALGVQALAREDATRLLLVGSGHQAMFMVAAVLTACPRFTSVDVYDPLNFSRARVFVQGAAQRLSGEFGIGPGVRLRAVADVAQALEVADAVVTVTRATQPVIRAEWVASGTHFSCIGADMHGKQELDPTLLGRARIFADDIGQCTRFGELELAVQTGVITAGSVHGELGEVLTGSVPGRVAADDITIFDATGLALLDIACARVALQRAEAAGLVTRVQI